MLRRANKAEKTNQEWTKAWDWGDEVDLVEGLLDKNPVEVIQEQNKCAFLSCWTGLDHEAIEQWEDYTPGGEGVVIKSTVGQLIEAIEDLSEDQLAIKRVIYCDFANDHGSSLREYARAPFSYKDSEYTTEQEIRAIVFEEPFDPSAYETLKYNDLVEDLDDYQEYRRGSQPTIGGYSDDYREDPIIVSVNLDTLIEEIRLSPHASSWEVKTVENLLNDELDVNKPVNESELDVADTPAKPAVDLDPDELYAELLDKEFVNIEDLAKGNYDVPDDGW
ncbi:hypothetical protein SAMN05216285_1239 [Natrinema salifodinae]|uniref:Uncharacterized protein n=2 Tax=Halobacteriales TaxID=2235 RepID=A0A1I0N1E8_9EURY|nr:hypothetical protein SAMN05216285_1239 [Natrinema salifodinae]